MSKRYKKSEILKYLYDKGSTYSRDLEKYFEKKIPRSSFYYYLKQLKNQELIKMEAFIEGTRTRIKYNITHKGIQEIQSEIEDPIIKLQIDIASLELEFFPLIKKLEKEFPLNKERKFMIFLMWPFIKNIIPNYVSNEALFSKIKLFILLNQINYNFDSKDLIGYSKFSKLFDIKKVDLEYYIERIIESSNFPGFFPDLHKLPITQDKEIFYSYSFGFGNILYSLIIYFMNSDLSFNPVLNLFPREFVGKPSLKMQKKLEELLSITSIEQYFEHFFDFEKEIIRIFPQNLKVFVRKFFKTNYLNSIIKYSKNIPYKKLYKTQQWRKQSSELIFSKIMNLFNMPLSKTKILQIKENLAMIEVIRELIFFFEIDKLLLYLLRGDNKVKRISSVDFYLKYLNERLEQVIKINKNSFQEIDETITAQDIDIHLQKFQMKFAIDLDETDLKFLQLTRTYNFELNKRLRNKAFKKLRDEIKELPKNLEFNI